MNSYQNPAKILYSHPAAKAADKGFIIFLF